MVDATKNLHVLICDPVEEKNKELIPILKQFGVKTVQAVPQFQDVPKAIERQRPNLIIIGDQFPDVKVAEVMAYLKIESRLIIPARLASSLLDIALVTFAVEAALSGGPCWSCWPPVFRWIGRFSEQCNQPVERITAVCFLGAEPVGGDHDDAIPCHAPACQCL